jgi:hypothetical protein
MDALLAFAAALLAFRLAGLLAARYRASGRPEMLAWSAGLAAYAVAAAAIAWGEAAGWDGRAFRVYYAAGALLTAPLLGAGSLLLAGRRRAAPVALVFVGLAIGISLAMPVHGQFAAHGIPPAQNHLAFLPARLLAVLANALGTLAVVVVQAASARQRADRRRHRRCGDGERSRGTRRRGKRDRDRDRRRAALRRIRRSDARFGPLSAENGASLSHKRCLNKHIT